MTGVTQAVFMNQRSFGPPAIGAAYEGGFFVGQISTAGNGVADYNLVIGPLSTAQGTSRQWKNAQTATSGSDSVIDGPQNTADMVADGNATVYPCAHFCNDLSIGGFTDWYMPAKNELEICYFNLKPTTAVNNDFGGTPSGANPNAVPARPSTYTSGTPAQTSVATFQTGGSEAFTADPYWSSTEVSSTQALRQNFIYGRQANTNKTGNELVRAVRRVPV
jgi:hypothetical protein